MAKVREVPMSEAIRVLGVSRRTVQRMLKDGTLKGRKQGGRWAISLPVDAQAVGESALSDLRAQLAKVTQERDTLAQRVADLESDKAWLQRAHEASLVLAREQQETQPDPAKGRSLWKRLSGWLDPTADVGEGQGE